MPGAITGTEPHRRTHVGGPAAGAAGTTATRSASLVGKIPFLSLIEAEQNLVELKGR
jgi:hypothetical protein